MKTYTIPAGDDGTHPAGDTMKLKPEVASAFTTSGKRSIVVPGWEPGYSVQFGIEPYLLRLDTSPSTHGLQITSIIDGVDQETIEFDATDEQIARINAVLAEWMKRG